MADDPLDALMSATLAIEGEEARAKRPALPFAGNPVAAPPPEPAPVDTFHVDSGTFSEGDPWPPQQAAPAQAAAHRAPHATAQVSAPAATAWQPPQPPAPVRVAAQAYAPSGTMPSAMPEMISRVVAGGPPQVVAPPPRISDAALARGATASAYAASNAATDPGAAGWGGERLLAASAPRASPAPQPARERIDYLWHDALAKDAILRAPALKKETGSGGLDDELLAPGQAAASGFKDGAAIRSILADRQPRSFDEVIGLYDKSLDAGADRLVCLVRGELALSFEPVESLRVTLSVVTPFLAADARLKDAYEAAQEALRTAGGIAPAVATSHKDRVDEVLRGALRGSSAAIESVIDRALIEGRAFARRRVFGGNLVRGLLHASARAAAASAQQPSGQAIPAYLTDAAADELPLMRSLPVRLIVEVRPSQDGVETHALAFRVLAIARDVELGARRR